MVRIANVFVLLAALTAPAAADVDLTGNWRFDATVDGSPFPTSSGSITQSGTSLSVVFPLESYPSTSQPLTGTIDLGTGAFTLTDGQFDDGAHPLGPVRYFNGTAAPDGASLSGTGNVCRYFEQYFGWYCSTIDVTATRAPATCGDGVVQAGEACDRGPANGGACCTVACVLVDPDGDGVCTDEDDCPSMPNPTQSDHDGNGVGDACQVGTLDVRRARIAVGRDGAVRRASVAGMFVGWFDVPSELTIVNPSNYALLVHTLPAWAAKTCTSTPTRVRCTTSDGSLRLLMRAQGPSPTPVRFRLAVKRPPGAPPIMGPMSIAVRVPDAIYVGEASSCYTAASGTLRCRP